MKEATQNGPLMDQPRRRKGLQLPQITTVFGTAEDVLEQRTESNNEDTRNGVMGEDDISGMVQDALQKARRATQALSPHHQNSNTQQEAYTSFFPSLENMMATSRSATLQHAQSLLAGNNAAVDGQREAAPKSSNTSDFVIRKVEDEIANAKRVAQEAFNRVKGVSAPANKDVIDLTDAYEQREMVQESFSQGHQLGASSTWRSEGPNSTWRTVDDNERPLDSMMSDDYGLVYDYAVAHSMSSMGQPTAFCSLDNPIIRVMEHTTMNIIDLTNVVEDVPPAEDHQLRAVSASVTSVGTEDNGIVVDTIKKTSDDSKTTEAKSTAIRSFPILPVKQERASKTLDASVEKNGTQEAENKTSPGTAAVTQASRAARAERLLKLRQPMNVVKEDSHEESQGTPEDTDKMTMEPEGVKDHQAKEEDGDMTEAVESGAVEEPVSDEQVEDALISSVETQEDVDDYLSTTDEPEVLQTESDVEEALLNSVETSEAEECAPEEPETSQIEEASEAVEAQESLESGFNALIDTIETADVVDTVASEVATEAPVDAQVESEQSSKVLVHEESDDMDTSSSLAVGFNNLLSFFRDKDERNFVLAGQNKRENETSNEEQSEKEADSFTEEQTESSKEVEAAPEAASKEELVTETSEEQETETPVELAKSDAPETASEEQPANNNTLEAEEKETIIDAEQEVVALINTVENSANAVENNVQNDAEVPPEQSGESKHPLLSFFDTAVEVRAPDFAAFGLGFMEAKKNDETPVEVISPGDQQQYNENLNKSGESNEKNSLIEEGISHADTAAASVEHEQMHSPLPAQYTADDEFCTEPVNSAPTEDFRYEPQTHEEDGVPARQFQPLGSLYRPLVPEEELEEGATPVSHKEKYDEPPAEYSTRPTEDIISENRVEAPIPQLSVLEPTDEIQKLQNSIMGESVTRRFNACGALKMFATSKSNQLALARTDGFFDALIVALTTDLFGKDREAAYGTRTRALEILLKICLPKENRVIIFYHPDLVEAIVNCAVEDSGEIRMAACSVFAMLAKSAHLREPMAQVEGLLDVLADSLLGVESQKPSEAKLGEVHEHEGNYTSDEFSSGSDSASDNFSTSGSESSFENSRGDSRRENKQNAAKLKRQQLEEKKKETTKQVTMSACATLLHLSKQCAAGHFMCHNMSLLEALLILSQQFDHPMHTRCLEITCNLTRLPSNNEILAEHPSVVPVTLRLATTENEQDRVWALRMLQNISASKSGKQVLVSTFALELLSMSVLRTQAEEQKAAMAALFNLSTDPGCLMAIAGTRDVLSSLVLVSQDMNIMSDVRLMACDTLSTVGLWFQKLAGVNTVPDGAEEVIPSNVTVGWNRWD